MGQKASGKVYSEDDFAVFSILANQTALAIENAKFFEDIKWTQEQLFQAEKMATIGTMADGLSHQINNRFHALGFIAGDALDTIHLNQHEPMSDKMKDIMAELVRAFVRVQENVVQGGEIVQGLLKYTRKGEIGFTAVDVDAAFQSGLEMARFKIKLGELNIVRDYDPASIPKIKGNFTQLQEVFFNLIDNGYDAMMQRKTEKKEPDYRPTLTVRVLKDDGFVQVILEDNGIGVKEEDSYKLFTPFFTTKLSSKKGTGLGLFVIKKIVEDNHGGQVEMVSKYMRGTEMKLRLPIAIA
jgi:C4-dicarboxylate-specific signal transduction histidine kinase